MKEALAWALGLTAGAGAGVAAVYALSGGGSSTPAPTTAKATPPPPPTTIPTVPVTVQPTPTPTPTTPPFISVPIQIQPKPTPTPTPTPPPVPPGQPGHALPLPPKLTTTSVVVSPGTITASDVGPAGSTLLIYVNPQGSVANQFSGSPIVVDGVQTQSITVPTGLDLTPQAGGAVYAQSGDVAAVQTTRDDGTIIVSWIDGNGTLQTTFIDYGTPPPYPGMMTVQIQQPPPAPPPPNIGQPAPPGGAPAPPVVSSTPTNGGTQSISGVGLTGSKIIITPPDTTSAILSPVIVDGNEVDLPSVNNGVPISILTQLWSGVIEIYWTSNLLPQPPGTAPTPITQPPAPGQQAQSSVKTTIYYGA